MRLTQAMIIERGWGCSSAQHRMQCQASVGRAMPSSPKIGAHMETTSSGSGVLSQLLRSFEDADIYLRFSVVGVVVFCILCCLICCAWSRYGSVISTLFDPQNKAGTDDLRTSVSQLGPVGREWTLGRSSSEYISWQQQSFPLSPETKKLDKATKKQQ